MVNIFEVPRQAAPPLLNKGVTVMGEVMGEVPLFMGVNIGILPEPLAGNPIVLLSIVQLNIVVPPVFVVEKGIVDVVAVPAQNTSLFGWLTCPVGFTVIVIVLGVPEQLTPPFSNVGVTVIVVFIGAEVILAAVNVGISPFPEVAKPTAALVLVHA